MLKQIPRREIEYLNLGSGASEEVSGPYHFPQMTLRVMPLRADKDKLQSLVDRYLENDFYEFEVAGQIKDQVGSHAVVCLIGANFEEMTAAGDRDTKYSDRELTFAVPVSWWEKRNPRIKRPALIPLYIFAGTDWNAVTSYEVYGQLSLKSKLVDPGISWLVAPTGGKLEPLVTVETELFPELGRSQEAQDLTVLEILPAPGTAARGSIATYLKQLGVDHFLTGHEFHSISLKQVMDAKDCTLADYQALVALLRQFTGRKVPAGTPATGPLAPLSIRVFDYPTFPIVRALGLVPEQCNNTGQYPIYTLNPIDPFWVSGAMMGDTGLEMCSRVGIDWRRNAVFDAALANGNRPARDKPNPRTPQRKK